MSNEHLETAGSVLPHAKTSCVFLRIFAWSVMVIGSLWSVVVALSAVPSRVRSSWESGSLGHAIVMFVISILVGNLLLLLAKADSESSGISVISCPKVIRGLQVFSILIGGISIWMFIWAVLDDCNCGGAFYLAGCDFERDVARNFLAATVSEVLSLEIMGHGDGHAFKMFFTWAALIMSWYSIGSCFAWGSLGRVCSRVIIKHTESK